MSVYHTLTISIVGLYSRCKHGRKAGANRRNNHDPRFLRILKLINTLKEEEQLTSLTMRSGIVPVDNGRVLPGRSTVLATSQQAQSAVKQIQQSFCNLVIYIDIFMLVTQKFLSLVWSCGALLWQNSCCVSVEWIQIRYMYHVQNLGTGRMLQRNFLSAGPKPRAPHLQRQCHQVPLSNETACLHVYCKQICNDLESVTPPGPQKYVVSSVFC